MKVTTRRTRVTAAWALGTVAGVALLAGCASAATAGTDAAHAGPDTDGPGPIVAGKGGHDERERRRHQEGGPESHDRPGPDERARRVDQRARQ